MTADPGPTRKKLGIVTQASWNVHQFGKLEDVANLHVIMRMVEA